MAEDSKCQFSLIGSGLARRQARSQFGVTAFVVSVLAIPLRVASQQCSLPFHQNSATGDLTGKSPPKPVAFFRPNLDSMGF